MIIRPEQIEVFEAKSGEVFAREMAEHVKSFAPKLCQVIGNAALLPIAKFGIERARTYGFENRGPISFFLELLCSFGSGFDTDPQLPWVSETLNDPSISTDMLRTHRLYERMLAYSDDVAGPNQQYATGALEKLLGLNIDRAPAKEWSAAAILETMADVYPQKFEFMGDVVATQVVAAAEREATGYSLPPGKGSAVLAGMKFAMGHMICDDPLYPWVGATLKHTRTIDGEGKLARLVSKLRTYGTHVLAHFGPS